MTVSDVSLDARRLFWGLVADRDGRPVVPDHVLAIGALDALDVVASDGTTTDVVAAIPRAIEQPEVNPHPTLPTTNTTGIRQTAEQSETPWNTSPGKRRSRLADEANR